MGLFLILTECIVQKKEYGPKGFRVTDVNSDALIVKSVIDSIRGRLEIKEILDDSVFYGNYTTETMVNDYSLILEKGNKYSISKIRRGLPKKVDYGVWNLKEKFLLQLKSNSGVYSYYAVFNWMETNFIISATSANDFFEVGSVIGERASWADEEVINFQYLIENYLSVYSP